MTNSFNLQHKPVKQVPIYPFVDVETIAQRGLVTAVSQIWDSDPMSQLNPSFK